MTPAALDVLTFLGLIATLAVVSWRRTTSSSDFTVASRDLGLLPLVATLVMTEFNTSTLMAFAAAGYMAGPVAVILPTVFLVGLAFYTVTVARAWKRFDRLSVAELFTVRYSPAVGRTASALLLLAMTGFTATYVKSLALLFAPLVPPVVPMPMLALGLTLIVLAAVLPGGLLSVVRADVVGFVATIVLLPLLLWFGVQAAEAKGGLATVFSPTQRVLDPVAQWRDPVLSLRFVVTLVVLTCFTYIAAPWYGQKIFAARSPRVAVQAVAISAVLVFALYGVVVLAAAYLRVDQPALPDAQLAVPTMMLRWLPAGLRGLGLAVLFGAALTTLAGVWSAMATMLATDFGFEGWRSVRAQRVLLVLLAGISWLGATFLVDRILDRLILANIPIAALSFALLAGFHWPRATTAAAWASMAVGVVWGVGCYLVVGEAGGYTWPWAIYGIPLIFLTGIVVTLMTNRRSPAQGAGWIAAVCIGMLLMPLTTARAQSALPSAVEVVDHGDFDRLLRQWVTDGMVDYDAFARSPDFARYLSVLERAHPERMARADQLAYWINTYNAYTIQLINSRKQRRSIRDINKRFGITLKSPWAEPIVKAGGRTLTLDDVEHTIIRPTYKDARIHVALVCAAKGCPPLRSEAFVGSRIDMQLDEQARRFLGQTAKNRVDVGTRTVYGSPIFTWYRDDFGGTLAGVGAFWARYLPEGPARELMRRGDFRWVDTDYDWTLNIRTAK